MTASLHQNPRSGGTTQGAGEQIAERCRTLGLAAWRCDNSGLVLAEPHESGPVGLLLHSDFFARRVTDAVRRWAATDRVGVIEAFAGCWLIPIEESHRRRRTGFTVLAAFGPECLASRELAEACVNAHLDVAATRKALTPRARFGEQSAETTRRMLLWMIDDVARCRENEQTAGSFTRQLTDAYETIDLLYSLGRSMNDLNHPDKFIARLCERVKFTLNFGWVSVWISESPSDGPNRVGRGWPSRMFASGDLGVDKFTLVRGFKQVISRCGAAAAGGTDDAGASSPEGQRVILTELDGRPISGSGQILVQPVLRGGTPIAVIAAGDKSGDDPQVSSYDIQLLEAAAGFIGAFLDNAALYAEQEAMFLGTLVALTASIDAKDRYTCGHSQRVAHLSQQLALAAGMSAEQADRLRIAGLVHDVGKIGVPEAVLCKAGKLTDEEFAAIKLHPEIGHRILRDIPHMDDVLPGVLHHHERYDGRGYPRGLAGQDIPLSGRIIAIADTFDAMSSTRSYRSAMPRATVLAELQRSAGTQLDPELVARFVTLDLSTYDRMVSEHAAGANAPLQPFARAA